MAAPALAVDWEAIKAHALRYGPREAARAFQVKEGTVLKRCATEKWLAKAGQVIVPQPLPESMQPKVIKVIKASEAEKNSMEKLGSKTKLVQAKAVLKGSQAVNRMPGEAIVERADKLAALVKAGAVLHGSQANTAFLGLHVTVRADQAQVVDVEAEVSPAPDQSQQG